MLQGKANWTAFAVGAGTLAVILLLKGRKRVPGILIAVVGAPWLSAGSNCATRAGVPVIGSLPQGLPAFAIPWISVRRHHARAHRRLCGCDRGIRGHQRALAYVCGADRRLRQPQPGTGRARSGQPRRRILPGLPISSSSSRTPVAEAAGAKSQLTGIVGAISVALLLVAAPRLLQYLPGSALAAVVIASAIGLFEFDDLRRIYRIQHWEFWLSIVCLVGVAVFGAIPGIGLAIVIAVIEFLWDGWRPHHAVLGASMASRATMTSRVIRTHSDPRPCAVSLGCALVFRQR